MRRLCCGVYGRHESRQITPILSNTNVHHERHLEWINILHVFADQLTHGLHFLIWNFEDEFIMYLEGHARTQFAARKLSIDLDHGQLDDVGCGPLERRIDCSALGETAHVRILAVDVGNLPDATEERAHPLLAARFVEDAINVGAHTTVALEIGFDIFLGFLLINAELRGESKRRDAVDDSKVHSFGAAAVLGCDEHRRDPEYFASSELMDVVLTAVSFDQQWIIGEVGKQP